MFDPFKGTLEEAQACPDAYETRGAVDRWWGATLLTADRAFYESHPLDGMAVCAVHDLIAPDWLARAFLRCFRSATLGNATSWDVAFGPPFEKGRKVSLLKRKRRLMWEVFPAVNELRRSSGAPLDRGTFERIGERLGLSASAAEKYYYEHRHALAIQSEKMECLDELLSPYAVPGSPVASRASRKILGKT